jgi:hypothetical protein
MKPSSFIHVTPIHANTSTKLFKCQWENVKKRTMSRKPILSNLNRSVRVATNQQVTSYIVYLYIADGNWCTSEIYIFVQNIFTSILSLDILHLCSSTNVRYQLSHPYMDTGNIIVCKYSNNYSS